MCKIWERTVKPMEKLKPCPFCGGEAELRMIGDMRYLLVYSCKDCRKTPLRGGDARSTERDARKIWNRRVEAWNRRVNYGKL